jgi:hypothetical protein
MTEEASAIPLSRAAATGTSDWNCLASVSAICSRVALDLGLLESGYIG